MLAQPQLPPQICSRHPEREPPLLAAQKIAQLRRMVDNKSTGREHVQMYGIPQLSENVELRAR